MVQLSLLVTQNWIYTSEHGAPFGLVEVLMEATATGAAALPLALSGAGGALRILRRRQIILVWSLALFWTAAALASALVWPWPTPVSLVNGRGGGGGVSITK